MMEKITDEYLQKWSQTKTFTWCPELRDYTFDIASNLFISTDGGSQTPLGRYFEDWGAGLFTILAKFTPPPLKHQGCQSS